MKKNGILPKTRKVKRKNGIMRTNCKAQMRARLTEDGKYEVPKHTLEHKHTLTRKEWNHLHRSEREIRERKGVAIMKMTSFGIRPADSYRYLAHSAGGEE
ncbi:hypothetical protein ACS0TY_021578 [Phlomoides rotata]